MGAYVGPVEADAAISGATAAAKGTKYSGADGNEHTFQMVGAGTASGTWIVQGSLKDAPVEATDADWVNISGTVTVSADGSTGYTVASGAWRWLRGVLVTRSGGNFTLFHRVREVS